MPFAGLSKKQDLTPCDRAIIFPLSNPSPNAEAEPEELIRWTNGDAIIATGSPFESVMYEGRTYQVPQCNNSYVFPGLGLGVLAVEASRISDQMLAATSETLAAMSPKANDRAGELLPPIADIATINKEIAFSVAKVAQEQGFAAELSDQSLREKIEELFWLPKYRPYKCSAG